MIALRTFAADSGPAAASTGFVSIAQPVGVRDGDLLLVGIAVPAANETVAPPDGWTQVAQTDPSRAISVAAFWKFAFNEPARWAFALSSSTQGRGGVLVYGGVDALAPIEVFAAAATAGSVNQKVAGISTSADGEELVALLGAAANQSFTPAAGWLPALARKDHDPAISFAAHRIQQPAAAAVAPFTSTLGGAADGASLIVALRPGVGQSTVDDVRRQLVANLPAGADEVYDLEAGGDYYYFFQSIAEVLKTLGTDMIDALRLEAVPRFSRLKLPSWESFFGLLTGKIARVGTIPQRQAQVLSAFRALFNSGASVPQVQAIMAPLLGYAVDASPQYVVVLEADRAALDAQNGWDFGAASMTDGTHVLLVRVEDDGLVSGGGCRLYLNFDATDLHLYTFTLAAPCGPSKTWSGADSRMSDSGHLQLFGAEFVGARVGGTWTLTIVKSGGAVINLTDAFIFVEGDKAGQQTAGAIFDWGVYFNPPGGGAADLAAVRAAVKKISPSHAVGNVIQSEAPYPDTDTGLHAAIPDECVPT